MKKEQDLTPESQLRILEEILKPRLGRFVSEFIYISCGLLKEEVRLVDESAFLFTGIPIIGHHLANVVQGEYPHIHIAVKDERYHGPKSLEQSYAHKIILPRLGSEISGPYKLAIPDLVKGSDNVYRLPFVEVALGITSIFVPEPAAHVREFAQETILFYNVMDEKAKAELKRKIAEVGDDKNAINKIIAGTNAVDESKFRIWFKKLEEIKNVSTHLKRRDVEQAADEVIQQSIERWRSQNWSWLVH